jgi:hypothetical protein
LGSEANQVPPLPTEAVLRQLDELRRWLGPKSNVQITDGEVTLRPAEELSRILRHARSIGVIPMVMTHGDAFRRQPGLLERLMTEGGLTEMSLHIDITQRGRDGYKAPKSELELMPLREELAGIVRKARRRTGLSLRVASTITVTRANLSQMGEVVRWTVRNRDAFTMISFQPLAQVGRTRRNEQGVTPEELWREVGRTTAELGLSLNDTGPLYFGHPACSVALPLIAIERRGEGPRLLRTVRNDPEDLSILEAFFALGVGGAAFRDDRPIERAARLLGMLRRVPRPLRGRILRWVDARLREELGTSLSGLTLEWLQGRVRVDGFTLASHHFMSPDELRTPLGQERLDACVFRLPHEGRMVSMCQMNAGGVRERIYSEMVGEEGDVEG